MARCPEGAGPWRSRRRCASRRRPGTGGRWCPTGGGGPLEASPQGTSSARDASRHGGPISGCRQVAEDGAHGGQGRLHLLLVVRAAEESGLKRAGRQGDPEAEHGVEEAAVASGIGVGRGGVIVGNGGAFLLQEEEAEHRPR